MRRRSFGNVRLSRENWVKHKDPTRHSRNRIYRNEFRRGVPLLGQEGWTRHQENAAKPRLKARTGWSVRRKRRRAGLTTPSAPLRNGIFFLMAQPPLLFQEGNTLASATRSCDGGGG